MNLLFEPLNLRRITLPDRIAVSPMCQYSTQEGLANDWHLIHLDSHAVGGADLVIVEAAAVLPEGRITADDLDIWSDAHTEPLHHIIRFIESQDAVAGVQLTHAGRKTNTWRPWLGRHGSMPIGESGWIPVAPSVVPFDPQHTTLEALSEAQIEALVQTFVHAAECSLIAGFKVAEVCAAHGYLSYQFLSPLSSQRHDQYDGCFKDRIRLLLQVTATVRKAWPEELPLFVRLSATDWVEDDWSPDETMELARRLKDLGVNLINVSSGGIAADAEIPIGPDCQTEFVERVKEEADIASDTMGTITEPIQAGHVLRTGQTDLILLAHELLRDPYWPSHAADKLHNKRMS